MRAVWLELVNAGCRAADNLIEGPDDVDFNVRAPEEKDSQLFGQPLCCWALGIQSSSAVVAGAPILYGVPCVGLIGGVLGEVSCELHAVGRVLVPVSCQRWEVDMGTFVEGDGLLLACVVDFCFL